MILYGRQQKKFTKEVYKMAKPRKTRKYKRKTSSSWFLSLASDEEFLNYFRKKTNKRATKRNVAKFLIDELNKYIQQLDDAELEAYAKECLMTDASRHE